MAPVVTVSQLRWVSLFTWVLAALGAACSSSSEGTGGSASTGGTGAGAGNGGTGTGAGGAAGAGGGAFPDETTTGPDLSACAGGVLTPYTPGAEPFYRAVTGEVISCMEFTDVPIYVGQDVSNVTVRNCRFVATQDTFLNIQGANVTIEDTAFEGPVETWIRNSYEGHELVVRRCNFSGMANAVEFNVHDETLEDNYAHDFGSVSPDQHADGLQTDGTSHAVLRHNTVLLNDVAGKTGAISVFAGDDVLVERNQVAGGGYTIYAGGPTDTNLRFLDNCFSTIFYPGQAQTGEFGPWYPVDNPTGLVRTGNTWCDGPLAGQPVNE
jgi:hypothetical protein